MIVVHAKEPAHGTYIASVERAALLLETIGSHSGGISAKHLSEETGIPLATVYHLLRTLVRAGLAERLPGGRWALGELISVLAAKRDHQVRHRTGYV